MANLSAQANLKWRTLSESWRRHLPPDQRAASKMQIEIICPGVEKRKKHARSNIFLPLIKKLARHIFCSKKKSFLLERKQLHCEQS